MGKGKMFIYFTKFHLGEITFSDLLHRMVTIINSTMYISKLPKGKFWMFIQQTLIRMRGNGFVN